MMIGVICSCAPSFSKILQEHPSSFETLKSRLHSLFRPISHAISKGSTKSSSGFTRGDPKQHSGDRISYKERLTRGRIAGDGGYELHDGNFFQTFVPEGPGTFATEDDHVESDSLQERAPGDEIYWGDQHKLPPFMAVRQADMV